MKVYISSTSHDLQEQRAAVIAALADLGHEPVAMEAYRAEGRRPIERCREDVRACDLYVGIVAWRYGDSPPGYDKSFTELEYGEAKTHGVETKAFLLDEEAQWPRNLMDRPSTERVEGFRDRLSRENMVEFFGTVDELVERVVNAVRQAAERQVVRRQSGVSPAPAANELITDPPMVGQARAQRILTDALKRALEKKRIQIVFVEAEAGAGKRKLVDWFRAMVEASGQEQGRSIQVQSGSYLDGLASYYRGIREILEKVFGIREELRLGVSERVRERFVDWDVQVDQSVVDFFVDFLRPDLALTDQAIDQPAMRQEILFNRIAIPLVRASQQTPLLLFLENLQYADEGSVHFLEHVIASLRDKDSKLLVVCLFDSTEKRRNPILLEAIERIARRYSGEVCDFVKLDPLSEAEMSQLIQQMLGAPLQGQERIFRMAQGNPQHVVEIIRYLHSGDLIRREDDRWVLPDEVDVIAMVPTQLTSLIESRLARIEHSQPHGKQRRALLEWAALAGAKFPPRLLEMALRQAGDQDLLPILDSLLESLVDEERILRRTREFGGGVLEFEQDLVRQVILLDISQKFGTPKRHQCIAQAMLELHPEGVQGIASELAYHYEQALEEHPAVEYYVMAAQVAEGIYSFSDAAKHLQSARRILKSCSLRDDCRLGVDILLRLGRVYAAVSNFAEAVQYYQEALAQSRGAGDVTCEIYALAGLGAVAVQRGDQGTARGHYTAAMGLAQPREMGDLAPELLAGVAYNYMRLGSFDEALARCDQWLDTYASEDLRFLRAGVLNVRGTVQVYIGNLEGGRPDFMQAASILEHGGDRIRLSQIYNNLGEVHRKQGQLQEAAEFHERAFDMRKKLGDRSGETQSLNNLGLIRKARGDLAAAAGYFDQAIVLAAEIGNDHRRADSLNNLGTIYRLQGELDRSVQQYQAALNLFSQGQMHNEEAIVLGNIGLTEVLRGHPADAREAFERSAVLFDDGHNHANAALVYHDLAVLCRQQGDTQAAPQYVQRKADAMAETSTYQWPPGFADDELQTMVDMEDI